MKTQLSTWLSILAFLLCLTTVHGATFSVNSQVSFDDAQRDAVANDSIIWQPGTYADIVMFFYKDSIYTGAEVNGGTIFNGFSRVVVESNNVTLEGVQFVGGNIGTSTVIDCFGSNVTFSQLNIRAYSCYKYLRIREQCQYNTVIHCNFENRITQADQNILSILVDNDTPGYHKIQYCSFKNFPGGGNDEGVEPIRIGVSSQADFISRSLVEYCYFTNCDGDGEIISSKATQNVYRYNTFENNTKAELVLRHGSEGVVYGNFFLGGKGGVRVREGQDHYIYNNYFYDLDDRPIFLQNESSDPLANINIAYNTIINCDEVRLGSSGSNPPTNVTFANNIFADPKQGLFQNQTGTETWLGNLTSGTLGITRPASGLTEADLQLVANSEGYFGLAENSPAVNAAVDGYVPLPQFPGMDPIDTDILLDLMQQQRPAAIAEKDLGCSEFPHTVMIQPIATEENTGPDYNSSVISSVNNTVLLVDHLLSVSPNPVANQVGISLESKEAGRVVVDLFDLQGKLVRAILTENMMAGQQSYLRNIADLPAGMYVLRATLTNNNSTTKSIQSVKLTKL